MAIGKNEKATAKDFKIQPVKLKATNAHPHIKEGEVFEVHPAQKDKLIEYKWAVEESEANTKVKGAKVPKGTKEITGEAAV